MDHLTSGSRMFPSLSKFNCLSHTNFESAVSFLLYSALKECRCLLILLLISVFVMPTYTEPLVSALYTTLVSLHSPGSGHFILQLQLLSVFFSFIWLRTFLLCAAIIWLMLFVVEYDSLIVCLLSATERSWLAGKCLSINSRNFLPMLVTSPLLKGGFQYTMCRCLFFFLSFLFVGLGSVGVGVIGLLTAGSEFLLRKRSDLLSVVWGMRYW